MLETRLSGYRGACTFFVVINRTNIHYYISKYLSPTVINIQHNQINNITILLTLNNFKLIKKNYLFKSKHTRL